MMFGSTFVQIGPSDIVTVWKRCGGNVEEGEGPLKADD